MPSPPRPRDQFLVLQRWEGPVTSADGVEFTAITHDLTDPSFPDEEVTLPVPATYSRRQRQIFVTKPTDAGNPTTLA
jgi:hypothetical protein